MTFSPRTLGAPPWFKAYRDAQLDALFRISDSTERFNPFVLPTGIGKSLLAWSVGAYTGQRVLILTYTRYLNDMYADDFDGYNFLDIRGQQNYPCVAVEPGQQLQRYGGRRRTMCNDGPCHHGVRCKLASDGCLYFDRVRAAEQHTGTVSTNYSYWLAHGKALMSGRTDHEPLGKFDVLIMDEAHEAVRAVRDALRVELSRRDLMTFIPQPPPLKGKIEDWQKYAHKFAPVTGEMISELRREVQAIGLSSITQDSLRRLKAVREGIEMVATVNDEDWVMHEDERAGVVYFDVVHPHRYCEQILYRGIERVVMMSATLTMKDVQELGAA